MTELDTRASDYGQFHRRLDNRQPLILAAMVALLLLVSVLATYSDTTQSLWYDEIWFVRDAGGMQYGPISLVDTANMVVTTERNPPGYFELLNLWGRVAGWSDYAGWFLSMLLGLLAIAWTYRLGYDVAGALGAKHKTTMALSAAVALGLSAFFIQYLHELRPYVMVVTVTAFTLWAYWRLVRINIKPSILLQVGFVLGVSAMLYTHYMTAIVLFALGLYHLLFVAKNGRWWRIVGLVIIGGVVFIPWVGTLILQAGTAYQTFHTIAMNGFQVVQSVASGFSSGSVALLLLLLAFAVQIRRKAAGWIWFVTLIAFGLALVINVFFPILIHIRYLIALWPLLALLVSFGVERLARAGISPVWILGVWILAGTWNTFDLTFYANSHGTRLPWKQFIAQLAAHVQPTDVMAFHVPVAVWAQGPELEHYMYGIPIRFSLTENIAGKAENNDYAPEALKFMANAPRVWLGVDRRDPPNFRLAEFKKALAVDYMHCYTAFDDPEMSLDLYAHNFDSLPLHFGNDVGIQMALGEALRVQPNKTLSVLVETAIADSVPRNTYSVGLHIVDASGQLKAQLDYGLTSDARECRLNTVSVAGLPAGTYKVLAVVYNWQTSVRLSGSDAETSENADRLTLGTFTIPN